MTYIVGYTFNASNYCAPCCIEALPTGNGQAFAGWALLPEVYMAPEDNLNEIAAAFGFDRADENTFDSSEFPKVIFASSEIDYCETCHELL